MYNLEGKVALVTGATGGIGSDIAAAITEQGGRVALTGTRAAALKELAGTLGGGAKGFPCNLSERAEIDDLVRDVEAEFGRIDILVNNAGINRDNLAIRLSDEDWDKVIEVNLTAAFRLTRTVLRGMIRRRAGRIVTVSSVVGTSGNPGQANYAAAKAGLIGMTMSIAQEVATRNITANCVAPGYIETPMTAALEGERREAAIADTQIGRFGTPREVAGAVVFLASDEAAYITGETIQVNGGLTMSA